MRHHKRIGTITSRRRDKRVTICTWVQYTLVKPPLAPQLLANMLNRKVIEAPGAKKDCGFFGDE
jgi:hypothetical protein